MKMNFDGVEGRPLVDDYYGFVKRYLNNSLGSCFHYLRNCSSLSRRKSYFRASLSTDFYKVFIRASQLGLLSLVDIEQINSTYRGTQQESETLVSWLILIEELGNENETI